MRAKLYVAVLLWVFVLMGVAHQAGYDLHSYGWLGQTQNGGIVIDLPNDWYGYELWGSPGFFHHVD